IVIPAETKRLDTKRVTALREDLSAIQSDIKTSYLDNIGRLRSTFLELREKERQLIATNLDLLNSLKESVEFIKSVDDYTLRQAERDDFTYYKKNIDLFGKHLIFALILMLIMIIALIYYQLYATSNERRLGVETDYANRLAEEKTSVLANISHEIRTPLNSLLGIIDLLKNRGKSSDIDGKLIDSVYYSINVIS